MNGHRFDHLSRSFGQITSRRTLLRTAAFGVVAAVVATSRRQAIAQPPCDAPLIDCDGTCVNSAFDPLNCGACGAACGEGESCQGGASLCPHQVSIGLLRQFYIEQ